MKRISFVLVLLFMVSFAFAGSTCLTVNSKNTNDYLNEISSLNSQLGTCTIQVQSNVHSLVGDGNVLASIAMNDGTTENFYVTITNKVVTGITKGSTTSYSYEVRLSEDTLDSILNSNDAFNAILAGVNNGDITVKANSWWGGIKWFFAKFFLPKAVGASNTNTPHLPQGTVGKPENCDDTYLPGHRDYAANKDVWDSYSAGTDKVCQSQIGKGAPNPCIHMVQLSVSGNPYYLCWYNE